jgi:predicted SAM-dependent methyltransferase
MFLLGMKRDIKPLIADGEYIVNLGAGNSKMEGAINLDLPYWNAETDGLPFEDESKDTIHAYHLFEHLTAPAIARLLLECQRVLKVDGVLNVLVPHRLGQMAYQDLDHKTFWCEETWKVLMNNPHYARMYDPDGEWQLEVHANFIMGLNERNLALLTQLIKV